MKNWQGMIITHPDITKASTKYLAVDLPSSATSGRVNLLGLESLTPTPTTTTTSFPSPTCKTSADCGTENTFCTKTETNIETTYKNADNPVCQDFFKGCHDFFKDCQDSFKDSQDFFKGCQNFFLR